MCESVPFFLPIGLRTASTISASVTCLDMDTSYSRRRIRSMLRKDAKIELLAAVPLFADCSKRELQARRRDRRRGRRPGRLRPDEGGRQRPRVRRHRRRRRRRPPARPQGERARLTATSSARSRSSAAARAPRPCATTQPTHALVITASAFRGAPAAHAVDPDGRSCEALAERLPPEFSYRLGRRTLS